MKNLFAYTLPREFEKINIPIPVQSTYLRTYAEKMDLIYNLPQTEICFRQSYHILKTLIRHVELNNTEPNIGMISILMLPIREYEKLKEIIKLEQNIVWHFPLEGLVLKSNEVLDWSKWYIEIKNK